MGHVIAIIPTSGGAGATTLAAAVAVRAAAAGREVVAIDLDWFGGRLDVVLGVEQEPGWRWDRLADVAGVVDGIGLARELPRVGCVAVLSGGAAPGGGARGVLGRASELAEIDRAGGERAGGERAGGERAGGDGVGAVGRRISDVVAGLARAHDVTVLDLGRDAAAVAAVAPLVDGWVAVVGTRVPQLASAAVSVPILRQLVDGAEGSGSAGNGIRRRCEPWVVLRGPRVDDDVADAVCDHLDVPVVASLRDDLRLVSDVTDGVPPGTRGRGPVVEAADELLLRLVTSPPRDAAATVQASAPAPASAPMHEQGRAAGPLPDPPPDPVDAAAEWRWSA